jgi:hypothetical protein
MHRRFPLIASCTLIALVACQKDDQAVVTTSQDGATRSVSADSAQSSGRSLVRVVNAVAGGQTITARVNGEPLFDAILPGEVSAYSEVEPSLAAFTVSIPGAADATTAALDERILINGNRYTVFLIAEDVTARVLRVVRDDVVPDSGKARLRVVHAAPGGPSFDVRAANGLTTLFSGVSFKREAGFLDVEPSTVDLEFRAANGSTVLLRVPGVDLQRGTATTIVVTGASVLQYIKFTDLLSR